MKGVKSAAKSKARPLVSLQIEGRACHPMMVTDGNGRSPMEIAHLEAYWDLYGKAPKLMEQIRSLRAHLSRERATSEHLARELSSTKRELNRIRDALKTLNAFAAEPDEDPEAHDHD